jgi:hypothetical protein
MKTVIAPFTAPPAISQFIQLPVSTTGANPLLVFEAFPQHVLPGFPLAGYYFFIKVNVHSTILTFGAISSPITKY